MEGKEGCEQNCDEPTELKQSRETSLGSSGHDLVFQGLRAPSPVREVKIPHASQSTKT